MSQYGSHLGNIVLHSYPYRLSCVEDSEGIVKRETFQAFAELETCNKVFQAVILAKVSLKWMWLVKAFF